MNGSVDPRRRAQQIADELGVHIWVDDHQLSVPARTGEHWIGSCHVLVISSLDHEDYYDLWSSLVDRLELGMHLCEPECEHNSELARTRLRLSPAPNPVQEQRLLADSNR